MRKYWSVFLLGAAAFISGCTQSANTGATANEPVTVHVGYFPNITHAQPLVGLANGTFQKELGDNVTIESTTFNAGPEEIEALFAGEIDLGYIGPSPALNGYIQSQGEALKIVSGAMSGGAVLVLQPDLAKAFAEQGPEALRDKKFASPQQGNTQDISLKYYLKENGLTDSTTVIPIANADQLTLFGQGELDGSWAPEPWASRLVQEAGAVVALDERDLWPNAEFPTTVLIARTEFLEEHPEVVKKWVAAHTVVTDWIQANPTEAQKIVNEQILAITGKSLSETVLAEAWARLNPQTKILEDEINTFATRAEELELLDPAGVDLNGIYDRSLSPSDSTQ